MAIIIIISSVAVGGRNRKVAEAFARNGGKRLAFANCCTNFSRMFNCFVLTVLFFICRSFDELEAEMLQGQKLQVDTEVIVKMAERNF